MTDIVLKVNNVSSQLITNDLALKEKLSKPLRFRPHDYFHNAAYQAKKWDGYKYFFDKKNGKFLTGILPEILAALKHLKLEYVFLDERTGIKWQYESIDQDFLNKWLPPGEKPITLHDFQPELVNLSMTHNRGIVEAPTGAGKTFILISLLKCLPPKTPTLFLTKSASLVDQNYQDMVKWGVQDLGRWYDKYKEPNYIMCCTVHKKTFESIENLLPKFKAIIVDEAHDCMSDVPIAAYKKMKAACVRIGISATAHKYAKKKIDDCAKWLMKGHFGPTFKTKEKLTTKSLQDRGILSKSDCYFYKVDKPDLAYEPYQSAIELGIEQNFHFHEMVAKLANSCTGRTLVVVARIEQGEYLKNLIPDSTFIQGKVKLKDRKPVIDNLLKGDKSVAIVMKQIITAGINVKIHDLINASGGEAAHNVIQLIGRGLRTADDKDILKYHDFLFVNNDYLRKHSEWRVEVLQKQGHNVTVKDTI